MKIGILGEDKLSTAAGKAVVVAARAEVEATEQ